VAEGWRQKQEGWAQDSANGSSCGGWYGSFTTAEAAFVQDGKFKRIVVYISRHWDPGTGIQIQDFMEEEMIRTNWLIRVAVVLALVGTGVAYAAQAPTNTVNVKTHPNLFNTNVAIQNAFNILVIAQEHNEFDAAGHASRAKGLLVQASQELNAAGK